MLAARRCADKDMVLLGFFAGAAMIIFDLNYGAIEGVDRATKALLELL